MNSEQSSLLFLFENLAAVEDEALELEQRWRTLKFELEHHRNNALLNEYLIQGKNEQIRNAQLSRECLPQEILVSETEMLLKKKRLEANLLRLKIQIISQIGRETSGEV